MLYFDAAVIFYILSFFMLLTHYYFNIPILIKAQTVFNFTALFLNLIQILLLRTSLSYSLQDMFLLATFMLGLVYFAINIRYNKLYAGFIILPIIIVSGLFILTTKAEPIESEAIKNIWLYIHIPLVILGMSFAIAAFTSGIFYFILERQLKSKKLGRVFNRFPSLFTIGDINRFCLYHGTIFYTLGLITAIGWLRVNYTDLSSVELFWSKFRTKIAVSIVCWIVITTITMLKMKQNLNAKQTAMASIIGFISVIIVYAGVIGFMARIVVK